MNVVFVMFSIVGFYGTARLEPLKIMFHGVFVATLCFVFVLYLVIMLALGKDDFAILLVIFCTVSVDIYACYLSLKFGWYLNKFEKSLDDHPELLSNTTFVRGSGAIARATGGAGLPMYNVSQSGGDRVGGDSCGGGGGGATSRANAAEARKKKSPAQKKAEAERSYAESRSTLMTKINTLVATKKTEDVPSQVGPVNLMV